MQILLPKYSRARGVTWAVVLSLAAHGAMVLAIWYYPLVATAIGLRNIQFVDEGYDRAILIDFSKKLSYPGGYTGFRPPEEVLSLEEIERREREERRRRETANRRRSEAARLEAERQQELAAVEAARLEAEKAASEQPAAPADAYPGGFGKINTAPIRDQVERLYNAHKTGKLVLPEGNLRVGVSGRINRDGSLSDCKVIIPSGLEDIDRAALAILDAVSASRALGPLADMTSLSMILSVGERAELSVAGFASSEQAAANIVNLANAAILYARFKKADDPAAMIIINNLKVSRSGPRVQAVVAMPRQKASESLAQTVGKS